MWWWFNGEIWPFTQDNRSTKRSSSWVLPRFCTKQNYPFIFEILFVTWIKNYYGIDLSWERAVHIRGKRTWISFHCQCASKQLRTGQSTIWPLADPRGGARDARSPLRPNFFIFLQFLGKIGQNNRLAPPPLRLAPRPLGNCRCATVMTSRQSPRIFVLGEIWELGTDQSVVYRATTLTGGFSAVDRIL